MQNVPEALVIGRISADHHVALVMLRQRRMLANINDLRSRAKAFALDIINLVKGLPRNIATDAIARQLIRAGTGVCANHRAAGRARSRREFIAKLAVVVEEADEAELWLEALLKCALAPSAAVDPLYREAAELRAIFCQSLHTARANLVREPNKRRAEKPGSRSSSVLP